MEPAPFSQYLKTISWLTPGLLLFTIGFNRGVDPFSQFDGPTLAHFNQVKPAFSTHLRLSKAAEVTRTRPRALILGTSRADRALDPSHPAWASSPVYNLSLSGANIYESLRYLQHAHATQSIEQAVLMLDYFMFNAVGNPDEVDFDESMLAVDSTGAPTPPNPYTLASLASLDATRESLLTVARQSRPPSHFATGMQNTVQKPGQVRNLGGHRPYFQSNEANYYAEWYADFQEVTEERDNWQVYTQLVQLAHTEGIDLRVGISPSHARQFETLAARGLWPDFERWKRKLVQVHEDAAKLNGTTPFPIWDFSGHHRYSTEPVPEAGDRDTQMQWYWESSHYKKALGDKVLTRVLGDPSAPQPTGAEADDAAFGRLLTKATIDTHLALLRSQRATWRAEHPQDVSEIDALVAD